LSAGLAFFLFATVVRTPAAGALATATAARAIVGEFPPETGVTPALASVAALERPLGLGGSSAGLTSPAISSIPLSLETAAERARRRALLPGLIERARRHPYVRLALNGSFSALSTGQLISPFGDRMHQVALGCLVLTA